LGALDREREQGAHDDQPPSPLPRQREADAEGHEQEHVLQDARQCVVTTDDGGRPSRSKLGARREERSDENGGDRGGDEDSGGAARSEGEHYIARPPTVAGSNCCDS